MNSEYLIIGTGGFTGCHVLSALKNSPDIIPVIINNLDVKPIETALIKQFEITQLSQDLSPEKTGQESRRERRKKERKSKSRR